MRYSRIPPLLVFSCLSPDIPILKPLVKIMRAKSPFSIPRKLPNFVPSFACRIFGHALLLCAKAEVVESKTTRPGESSSRVLRGESGESSPP